MKVLMGLAAAAALSFAASPALAETWDGSPVGTPQPALWTGGWTSSHKDNVLSPDTWLNFGNHGAGTSQYCVDTNMADQNCSTGGTALPVFFAGYINIPGVRSLPACGTTERNPDCDSLGGFFIGTSSTSGVGLMDEECDESPCTRPDSE
jgi:hypothetical protein